MRQDLDDCQPDGVAAPYVIGVRRTITSLGYAEAHSHGDKRAVAPAAVGSSWKR
jgi:hypothetical protein